MSYIIAAMVPVGIFTGFYLYLMMKRALTAFHVDVRQKPLSWILPVLSLALAAAACFFRKTWALVLYYVVGIDLVLRGLDFCIRLLLSAAGKARLSAYENSTARKWLYLSGLVPVLVTAVIMAQGVYEMQNVVPVTYEVQTEKNLRDQGYRGILIADSHYGVAGTYEQLAVKCDEIGDWQPDFVILAGDIVDETTEPEQVEEVFHAFGDIRSRYGTFFVWGNHDRSSAALKTQFSEEYLRQIIYDSGITILEDQTWKIGDDLVLVGREDLYEAKKGKPRASMADLMKQVDPARYVICIDHQPCAFTEEAEAGADLILCGHTHGGQIWPAGQIEELLQVNDGIYGRYEIGKTTAIVTSGFYGWSWPVRNQAKSEYVVIDLTACRP